MKLRAADVDRIMEANIPKPPKALSADDYINSNAQARDAAIESLTSFTSQSSARRGEVLPLPPRSLVTRVDVANDFGLLPDQDPGQEGTHLEKALPPLPPPLALRGVDLALINSRADLIMGLTQNLPMNELGLPKIIYRADLLDWHLFSGATSPGDDPSERYKTMQEYLDMATLHLSYAEGFPALPTGEPLWARMPSETSEHYAVFTEYCTMAGARQTTKLTRYPHDQLLQWFHEDYWPLRAQCFDMLQQVHAAKMREQRILSCEDNHYLEAENVWNRLQSMLSTVNWDILKDEPEKFVSVMERVAKLQRMSLGLSAVGDKREIKSDTIEVTMRKIAQPSTFKMRADDSGIDVKQLLASPEALASAQELVIRMTRSEQILQETREDENVS